MNRIASPESLRPAAGTAAEGPIAAQLAAFAEGLRAEDVPPAVIERAKLHILDCLGIGLASTTYEFGQRAANAIRGLGGQGTSPIVGLGFRLPPRDAILLNGTLIHGLDFDDTHTDGVIHASASALPTAIAAGLANRASGLEAIVAFLIAVETSARIGAAAQGGFHKRGHHPTGLVGAFGSTLGAGRLMDLPAAQLAMAQGIVFSMAAGNLEFLSDGAWTKRMHPGWAGQCGYTAAAMAKEGFVGPSAVYEGRYGLYNLHLGAGHEADLDRVTAGLGAVWELENVGFKPYPACHFNHSFADAALALRDRHGLKADDIARITALVAEPQAAVVCEPIENKRTPQNAYDAQFSIPYIVASSIVRGGFTLADLDPAAITDRGVLDLAARVDWQVDPDSAFPRYYSGELVVETRDGRTIRHREAVNRGSDANPLSADDIAAKYWSNAMRAVSRRRAQRVLDAVMELDRAPDLSALGDALSLA